MLLLFTLGMLILSLWGFKRTVFPNLESLAKLRESFITEAQKDKNVTVIWLTMFMVLAVLFAGLQSIYLGFAINFLLSTGALLAKVAAFSGCGLFLLGVTKLALLFKGMASNLNDPMAFRDVVFKFPNMLRQIYMFVVNVIWLGFYATLTYFLLQ